MKHGNNRFVSKLLITVCVFLLLGCVIWKVAEAADAIVQPEVEISPFESTYSFARHGHAREVLFDGYRTNAFDTNAFLVRFKVSNPSSTPCIIGYETCGYCYQFGTDNTNVSVQVWGCHANVGVSMTIDSTHVYSGELPLVVRTDTKPGQLSFRMCFVPLKKEDCDSGWALVQGNWATGKYWSDKITITVAP
jgi:hypothetical protein